MWGSIERRRRPLALVVSAVLVAIAALLAMQGGGGGDEARALDTAPRIVGTADLSALQDSLGHPLYWAGQRSGQQLELTEESDASIYLRYLPAGIDAGDPRPRFLTVGTYPVDNPVVALRHAATTAGAGLMDGPGGSVVLPNPSSEGSAYLAYPGAKLQIEVYDPAPGRALGLIRSGAIRPVGR